MKAAKNIKIVQLILTILFDIITGLYIYFSPFLKYSIFSNKQLLILCILIWIGSVGAMIFLIIDLTQMMKLSIRDSINEESIH